MSAAKNIHFAPHLYIPGGITDISFYNKAFNAATTLQYNNEDGSVHVAEFVIGDAMFHIHEEKPSAGEFCPGRINGTTCLVGLFVPDVDATMETAIAAGAILVNPAQNYDYGYRQGEIKDPFGHTWIIEARI